MNEYNSTETVEQARLKAQIERQKVLDAFFVDGRLLKSPAKMSKRNIAYGEILKRFEPGRTYTEKEVNAIIFEVYDDYCKVRRHFVDYGWMQRDNNGSCYQLNEEIFKTIATEFKM
ncbi:MAG: DUF2087 domain-containing protein [Christensenellaceae bacterium]|nr:DUF2087 domain-containing protein [Christensenellaceae bacterium]